MRLADLIDPLSRREQCTGCRIFVFGPKRAVAHPFDEDGNFVDTEFSFGWHLKQGIAVENRANQVTFFWITWDNGESQAPPLCNSGLHVQSQFTRLFCGPVALDAVLGQKRTDFCLKKSLFVALFVVTYRSGASDPEQNADRTRQTKYRRNCRDS